MNSFYYGLIGPTDSMLPILQGGELVRFEQHPPSVGDVVAFRADWGKTGRVIHRVVEIRGDKFFTQGDNKPHRDAGYRTIEDIEGVLVGVVLSGPIFRGLMNLRYQMTGW